MLTTMIPFDDEVKLIDQLTAVKTASDRILMRKNATAYINLTSEEVSVQDLIQYIQRGYTELKVILKNGDFQFMRMATCDAFPEDEFDAKTMQSVLPLIEIFIKIDAETTLTVSVDKSQSIYDVKMTVIMLANFPVYEAFEFMLFVFEGKVLQDHQHAFSVLRDQVDVKLFWKLLGGAAKRGRASLDVEEMYFVPSLEANDCEQVKHALAVKTVNIEPWVKSLDEKTTQELFTTIEEQARSGNIPTLVHPYLEAVKEYHALEDYISK
jgi:hypothetical protein